MGNLPDVNKIYVGSCFDILKSWPNDFIHTAVTSPPYYGLRDYGLEPAIWDGDPACDHKFNDYVRPGKQGGWTNTNQYSKFDKTTHGFCEKCKAWRGQLGLEPTPEMYIDHLVQIFRELRRCLRPDGTFWLNLGDSYAGGGKGWNVQAESSFKRHLGGQEEKFNNGQKPPTYITGKQENGIKPKDLIGIPWMAALALRTDGWYLRSEIIWSAPDKCPESAKDRPTRIHEQIFLLTKRKDYFYDYFAIKEPTTSQHKPAPGSRYEGALWVADQRKNKRSVWTVCAEPAVQYGPMSRVPAAVNHHAAFPEDLISPCVLAGTSEKGCCPDCGTPWFRVIEKKMEVAANGNGSENGSSDMEVDETEPVQYESPTLSIGWEPGCKCGKQETIPCLAFDPFMGSGTVALVARKNGRSYLGTEKNPVYADVAARRLDFVRTQDEL